MSAQTPAKSPVRKFTDWLNAPATTSPAAQPAVNGIPPATSVHTVTAPALGKDQRGGVVAAARRLTGADATSRNPNRKGSAGKAAEWQEEAWELLDLIGEQRFLASTLAGRMSQAALYVGRTTLDASPGTRPEHVEDPEINLLLASIGDGVAGQSQLIHRAGVNLFVAGECWLVGIPPRLVPGTEEHARATSAEAGAGALRLVDRSGEVTDDSTDDVLALKWRLLSASEVNLDNGGIVRLSLEDGSTIETDADTLWLIRIWRAHPRKAWEADSPTRASLPVLRELLGLTQHISAQVDSRLAGAGLLAISTEADDALKRAAGIDPASAESPLTEALIEAMQVPISDRSAASAIVPLVVTVPGNPASNFHYMNFSTELDKEARQLRDEAIRRLALGQDAPPELLLGTGGMNHWGAWLVREDVVKTHLEPPLALICEALTVQFLRPMLTQLGVPDDELSSYVVWYDVDHLIARPNRAQDAKDLFAQGVISAKALREATGFEEGDGADAAAAGEERNLREEAVQAALALLGRSPALATEPGLPALIDQIEAALRSTSGGGAGIEPLLGEVAAESGEGSTEGGIPNTADDPPPADSPAGGA